PERIEEVIDRIDRPSELAHGRIDQRRTCGWTEIEIRRCRVLVLRIDTDDLLATQASSRERACKSIVGKPEEQVTEHQRTFVLGWSLERQVQRRSVDRDARAH